MKRYFLLLLVLPILFLSACSLTKEETIISENIEEEKVDVVDSANKQVSIGEDINPEEVVDVTERKEFTAYGHTFSYKGDGEVSIENVPYLFDRVTEGTFLVYDENLVISDNLYWPSNIYKEFDADKVRYECDGTFLKSINRTGYGLKYLKSTEPSFDLGYIPDDNRWAYCDTNGKDYLRQFEFGSISGFEPLTTGGGFTLYWHVVYSKNIDGINYFFLSPLKGDVLWVLDSEEKQKEIYCKEGEECYSIYTKEYLDILLADEENQEKLAEWDKFVKSIELVK